MKLTLIRHGESEDNKKGIVQGWRPGKLSKNGIKQAKLVALRLKDAEIDVIYTSDLRRCVETAEEIKKSHKNAKFIKDKLLRERKWGEFEGTGKDKSDLRAFFKGSCEKRPKGGESLIDVWVRTKRFYNKLLEKYDKETILIIGHGRMLSIFQGVIFGKKPEDVLDAKKLENAAVSEFEVNRKGKNKIICVNCEKHLDS